MLNGQPCHSAVANPFINLCRTIAINLCLHITVQSSILFYVFIRDLEPQTPLNWQLLPSLLSFPLVTSGDIWGFTCVLDLKLKAVPPARHSSAGASSPLYPSFLPFCTPQWKGHSHISIMTRDKEQAGRINARTPAISGCLSTGSQEEPVMHSGRHHLLHPSGETAGVKER